jgi:hypothetical protein
VATQSCSEYCVLFPDNDGPPQATVANDLGANITCKRVIFEPSYRRKWRIKDCGYLRRYEMTYLMAKSQYSGCSKICHGLKSLGVTSVWCIWSMSTTVHILLFAHEHVNIGPSRTRCICYARYMCPLRSMPHPCFRTIHPHAPPQRRINPESQHHYEPLGTFPALSCCLHCTCFF